MEGATTRATVLIVEIDPIERELFGSWLEADRYDVITCPGPGEPDYTCVGAREGVCPLVDEARVVVLDMSTASEDVMAGTASEELLAMYLSHARRVVVLGSRVGEEVRGWLVRLRRHPDRAHLLEAVHSVTPDPDPVLRARGTCGPQ